MSFENYWKEVEKTGILARAAAQLLPNSFSEKLKKILMEYGPELTAMNCQKAINAINAGS